MYRKWIDSPFWTRWRDGQHSEGFQQSASHSIHPIIKAEMACNLTVWFHRYDDMMTNQDYLRVIKQIEDIYIPHTTREAIVSRRTRKTSSTITRSNYFLLTEEMKNYPLRWTTISMNSDSYNKNADTYGFKTISSHASQSFWILGVGHTAGLSATGWCSYSY